MAGKKARRADGLMQKGFRVDGKQYVVYGHNEKELFEKEKAKRDQIAQGMQRRNNPTLIEYYQTWSDLRRTIVKETTIKTQLHIFKTVSSVYIPTASRYFGEIRLQSITIDDLRIVQNELLKTHNTSGVNQYMQHINQVLSDAMRERLISYNPCCMIKPIKRIEEHARDTKHRALSIDEQQRFFRSEKCKQSMYYNLYRLAVCTGMRFGEIGALKQSDITKDCINVCRTLTNTENGIQVGADAKTKSGKRSIPMTDQIKQIIADQREQNKMLFGNIVSFDDLLFKTINGKLAQINVVENDLKRICADAGIDQITMHAFRATFATRAIESNMQPKTLQEILGHANFNITMSLYAHVLPETKIQAMQDVVISI